MIKVKPVITSIGQGETPIYRLAATPVSTITETEFLDKLVAETGKGAAECRYWLDLIRNQKQAYLLQNNAVDLGFSYARLYASGSLNSLTDQPTKEKNPVKVREWFKGAFADEIAKIECSNDVVTVDIILNELQQVGVVGRNRIENTTEEIYINGTNVKLDPAKGDVSGIRLCDLKTGVVVAVASIIYSDESLVRFKFETLPTTGAYKLLFIGNNDQGDDVAMNTISRLVQVVNEAA